MTDDEALRTIRQLGSFNAIVITKHARIRMGERRIGFKSIRRALTNATSAKWSASDGSWTTLGPDLDSEEMTLGVVIESDLIILTVY